MEFCPFSYFFHFSLRRLIISEVATLAADATAGTRRPGGAASSALELFCWADGGNAGGYQSLWCSVLCAGAGGAVGKLVAWIGALP
jgi:hypothetical protein